LGFETLRPLGCKSNTAQKNENPCRQKCSVQKSKLTEIFKIHRLTSIRPWNHQHHYSIFFSFVFFFFCSSLERLVKTNENRLWVVIIPLKVQPLWLCFPFFSLSGASIRYPHNCQYFSCMGLVEIIQSWWDLIKVILTVVASLFMLIAMS